MSSQDLTIDNTIAEERILLVIHDAFLQIPKLSSSENSLGDIILTDRSFYYVAYAHNVDPDFLFGLIGFSISKLTENSRYTALLKNADNKRKTYYGLKLYERPFLLKFSQVPGNRLCAPEATQISLSTHEGKEFNFRIQPMSAEYQEAINSWPNSPVLYDHYTDPDGFFLGSTSKRELLLRIANGDTVISSEVYQLGLNENFSNLLFGTLFSLEDDVQQKIISVFSNAPVDFRITIMNSARKVLRECRKYILISFSIILFFNNILLKF